MNSFFDETGGLFQGADCGIVVDLLVEHAARNGVT
jgi:hypothetical protein